MIKAIFAVLLLSTFFGLTGSSQEKFITKTGYISFLSETMLENIFAETNEASSLIDIKTGEIVFTMPIKSFHFKSKLMEEHFNENYMESEKFPKALFSGKLEGIDKFSTGSASPQSFKVAGEMTIHGVKQQVSTIATLTAISPSKIKGETAFKIKVVDYSIKVPSAVGMKIAEEVDVKVKVEYDPFIK
jgi:hypothetical protein